MIYSGKSFLEKVEKHIAANLSNDQFGVDVLADKMAMSRSNLHRRLKKTCNKNSSQYIREYRLEEAKKMLLNEEVTASEVSYKVGFGSPSYFSKCFTSYFGYPPSKIALNDNITLFDKTLKKGTSIMVLPFKNHSPNSENEYLVYGLADSMSRYLSTIDDLNVISSSLLHNSTSIDIIREKYNVASIIEGSIQQYNDVLRIEVKLLDTSDGSQIWVKHYDKKLSDILKIQSDIGENVVNNLKANISKEEKILLKKRTSYHPEAYNYYLKGVYHMNFFDDKKLNKSLIYFNKAITIDTSIAPAYAALATIYQMKASAFSATIDSKEAFNKAEHYLDTAIKLDEDWHFNFTVKGFQLAFFHWNFEEAENYYKKGLKANEPLNYIMYRDFLQFENRHKEALEISLYIDRNMPFYPNSPLILSYYYNGMYEEGEAFIEERLESFPTHPLVYDNAGFFMLNVGNYDKAIELFLKLIEISGKRFPRILAWMGASYAHKGNTLKAEKNLKELIELKKSTNIGAPAFFASIIATALGRDDDALDLLERSITDHEMEVPWLVSEPQLFPLHRNSRFDSLVKKVGFRNFAYLTNR
ncbi:helix-turn-helix domain-containing protein [Aquimarina megaterium]|uniref:helix-turn-helix domain-containing protein n=1 Tax=Aquimarina megaterium TaxID=1443666 RepID=UPI000471D191|nr:helix-turn-helix domain-containing protein [Aquimarina megaterium]